MSTWTLFVGIILSGQDEGVKHDPAQGAVAPGSTDGRWNWSSKRRSVIPQAPMASRSMPKPKARPPARQLASRFAQKRDSRVFSLPFPILVVIMKSLRL
jgi:hypothetical protein